MVELVESWVRGTIFVYGGGHEPHEATKYPGMFYRALRSAGGIRRPLRLLRKEK